jgi:hypothetical protein
VAAPREPEPIRCGVHLVQVAAVHAALAEGFGLDEVLAEERLPDGAWRKAEVTWKAEIAGDEAVLGRYKVELEKQQDRLRRRVEPLEEGLEDWVVFLRYYQRHAAPGDLLEALGLNLNDMARLGRRWSKRFDAEPKLAKQAAKLSLKLETRVEKGEKLLLPVLRVTPPALSPSSAAGTYVDPDAVAAAAEARAAATPVLGLDRYAALSAELHAAPRGEREAVLARFGVSTEAARALDEAWRARLESDPELHADFRTLWGHYRQQVTVRRRTRAEAPTRAATQAGRDAAQTPRAEPALRPLPLPPAPPPPPQPRTGPVPIMAHIEALPFRGAVHALPPIAGEAPPPAPRFGAIDVTADVIPALRDSEVLPFQGGGFVGQLTIVPSSGPDSTGNSILITLSDSDVSSFDPRSLDGTSALIPALRDSQVVPFVPESRPASPALPPVPVDRPPRHALDATTLVRAIDLEILDDPEPAPELTIDQLASMHAELAVRPREADAIRRRYHVATRDVQRSVEESWERRFAASPAERALYERKLMEFKRWLLAQRQP